MHVLVHAYNTGADDYDYSCLTPFIIIKCCWITITEAENFHISYFASDWFLVDLIVFARMRMYFSTRSEKILAVLLKEIAIERKKKPTVSSLKAKLENKPLCQHAVFMKIYLNLFISEPFKHFSLQPFSRLTQKIISRCCARISLGYRTEPTKPGSTFPEPDTIGEQKLSLLNF